MPDHRTPGRPALPGSPRDLLREAFSAAVAAVHPQRCVPPHVPPPARGRTCVVAIGKAAPGMARAFLDSYAGPATGIAVWPGGAAPDAAPALPGLRLREAAHPVPDSRSLRAAAEVIELLTDLDDDDLVVALVSGGGSALLAAPVPGVTLQDKQDITRQLLAGGATIAEINCVRRKISAVKGGRLAQLAVPAEVRVLAISDVPGDDPALIASGPFSPDPTTLADARDVLRRYRCRVRPGVRAWLEDPAHETPRPGDPVFARVATEVCARSADALAAAAAVLEAAGVTVIARDDQVNRPVADLAQEHARRIRERTGATGPVALLSGGETTVAVRHPDGRGGRNTEYLLHLALALGDAPGVWALAADSDGIDGTAGAAGALLAPDTLRRAAAAGLDPQRQLGRNQSGEFFAVLDDLLTTGPTGTNVSDVRIVLAGAGPDPRTVVG